MRPKRDPVPRARESWVWLGGLAVLGILGGGVTAAALLLWENIDIRELAPRLAGPPPAIPAASPPAPAAHSRQTFEAVLFSSPRNQAYFPDPAYYLNALESWSQLIRDSGGYVREVPDAEGLRGMDPQDLLVLVEAPCLSSEEADAVRAHLAAGGGVLANWAVGARDAACEWRGWQTVADLTGAEDVREIPSREGLFLTVPGGVSLSPGFDPGTRIELRPDPSLALRAAGPRVYWSDWALNPAPDESGGGADVAAVATYSPLGGRIAWLGLHLEQAATPGDHAKLARLAQNGIAWAAGVPLAAPAPWPRAKQAALVFALDVEDEPGNAMYTARLLRERGLPGSFYAVSQLVLGDEELAETLAEAGEVGSQTSDHTPLVGLTAQDQRMRLRRAADEIEAWTGVAPSGLRPPEETFDTNTLEAWQRAGGTYLLAGNEARSASPEIHRLARGRPLVLLPRVLKDDYNIIVQDRVLRATSLGSAFLTGTSKMRAIGGLAVIAGHTQIMREGPRVEALASVADAAVSSGDWWIAGAADVASWWLARWETTVAFEPASLEAGTPGQSVAPDVVVTAPAGDGITDLWIDLVLPDAPEGTVPLVGGRPVEFEATEWGMRVPVGPLDAGETRRITFLVLEDESGVTTD